jgi:hypothetical protein
MEMMRTISDDERIRRIMQARAWYLEVSKPIVRGMASVWGRPRIWMKDGQVELIETIYTPEQEQVLKSYREILDTLQQQAARFIETGSHFAPAQ